MVYLFPDIPKQMEIRLRAGETSRKSFYKLMTAERSFMDGIIQRSEVSRVVHITLTPTDKERFALSLETFDARRKDSIMSLGIKDLLARVERCYQDLELTLNSSGHIVSIQNMDQIREVLAAQKQYLEERFNGPGMQAVDQFESCVLQSEQTLTRYLCNDRKLGLLFQIPYGAVGASWMPMFRTRTNNFMDQTIAMVNESFRLSEANEEHIRIEGRGQLEPGIQTALFRSAMQRHKLPFHPQADKPVLIRYTRDLVLDVQTQWPLSAQLAARFEFGKSYTKEIDYQLTAVAAEEV
ncbi:hypothetical protein [Taibaiella koreensis]|uniref:hypothetical protein n=1 Tax=Taibaiella koreensis TaxID=1268548 RepID=UPI0013C327ED|nr:hypothetical protein [Taibaiella koreensis]